MQYITDSKSAELNAMKVMQEWGYVDATSPLHGADGGIDVFSSRALAQVKWKGAQVPRPDIQRLYGARGRDTSKALYFFAASGYSKQAIAEANKLGVGLFTYDPTGKVTPVNRSVEPQIVGMKRPINVDIEKIKVLALVVLGIAGGLFVIYLASVPH